MSFAFIGILFIELALLSPVLCYKTGTSTSKENRLSSVLNETRATEPIFLTTSKRAFGSMQLNQKLSATLGKGEVASFTYLTQENGYYVVETFGNLDTKLQVNSPSFAQINDDDSGTGVNARVYFHANSGDQITIYSKLFSPNISGTFQVQLRKQRMSMFAYVDDHNQSTIPDLAKPTERFSGKFQTVRYENTSAYDALSKDDRDLVKLDSEIVFFGGHGYKNSDDNKGFGVAFKTGGLTTDDTWPMEHAKVAMWAACYSANATNNKKISIAEYSVKMGAKAAVGFSESVGFSSSKTFTNRFFDKLAAGWTVKTAASHAAKGLLWPWDAGKKYKIFGNESTSVTSSTVSQSSFAPLRIDYDLLEDLKENAYVVSLGSNEERYYQTINGRLTNSFVDVTVSDGVVVRVDDCRKDFTYIQPISPSYLNKAVPQEIEKTGEIYRFAGRDFRHIVYFSDGRLMTPYEIVTADYVRNTDIIQETTCVSLTDGASIDYSLINAAA